MDSNTSAMLPAQSPTLSPTCSIRYIYDIFIIQFLYDIISILLEAMDSNTSAMLPAQFPTLSPTYHA